MNVRALHITSFCFLALGGVYLVGSLNLRLGSADLPGDGLYPFLVSIAFVALSGSLFIRSLKQKETQQNNEEALPKGKDFQRVAAVGFILVFFAVFLKPLGYGVCSVALTGAILKLLGMRSWGKIILFSILAMAISYYLFAAVLAVPLPQGFLFY